MNAFLQHFHRWRAFGARPLVFIVLDSRTGRDHRVHLSQRSLAGAVVAIAVSLVLGGWFLRYVGDNYVDAEFAEAWRVELDAQQQALEVIRQESDATLGALTRRFGALQARLVRMESLSERVASVAGVGQEFDLDELPALGGPEPDIEDEILMQPPAFVSLIDDLSERVVDSQQELTALEKLLSMRQHKKDTSVSGWPVTRGWLSSPFGLRVDPIHGRLAMHKGIDFAAHSGSAVHAVAAGVVTFSGHRSGFGRVVEVSHGDGYVTRYAHCQELRITVGEVVGKGDTIATVGSSGRATGPHVHFELLRNGRQMDPGHFMTHSAG